MKRPFFVTIQRSNNEPCNLILNFKWIDGIIQHATKKSKVSGRLEDTGNLQDLKVNPSRRHLHKKEFAIDGALWLTSELFSGWWFDSNL